MKKYNNQTEPMSLFKSTFELFLKQENPTDCTMLFLFYYYTSKFQNTNQIKALTCFTAKGLKWTEERVRKTKKVLLNLEIIEDMQDRKGTGKMASRYILLKVIHPVDFQKSNLNKKTQINNDLPYSPKTVVRSNRSTVKPATNALTSNKNALTSNKNALTKKINKKENSEDKSSSSFLINSKDIFFINLLPKKFKENKKFIHTWKEWIEYRKERKTKLTEMSAKRQIKMLSNYSVESAIEIIDRSILNGYTGLFENKNSSKNKRGFEPYQDKDEFGKVDDHKYDDYEFDYVFDNRDNMGKKKPIPESEKLELK